MKKRIQKIVDKWKKIDKKETLIHIKEWMIKNKYLIFLFLSLYILDLSTRIATNSIGFVHFLSFYPNAFCSCMCC